MLCRSRDLRGLAAVLGCCGVWWIPSAARPADDAASFRDRAPIVVQQPAAFVRLPLPASAYAHAQQGGLADLRVVDAHGERVPFALLAPRAAPVQTIEHTTDAALYPLPARPTPTAPWAAPIELQVQGDRVSVIRRPQANPSGGAAAGWLFDLGAPDASAPPPQALRVRWSGPAAFTAGFELETSDDLRAWRAAGSGQLMALASPNGPLTQPLVLLPSTRARFVRLAWTDPGTAPVLVGAAAVSATLQTSAALDPPTPMELAPLPIADAGATGVRRAAPSLPEALDFDLGAALPVVQLAVKLPPGTRVLPLWLQQRNDTQAPWQALAQTVAYRIERDGSVDESPPLAVQTTARYLRVLPDERAASPALRGSRLVVQAQLAQLVFAAQGTPPYALLAGSAHANPGALPVSSLVPLLDDERPRFGEARLGDWSEVSAAAQRADAERQRAAWRPWLLWAVLIAGVAALGGMVWRLARAPRG